MILTTKALRAREVIRICDGKSLGCVSDVCIDSATGRVCALLVLPDAAKLFSFGCREELSIPWELLRCIGDDAILVEIRPEDCIPRSHKTQRKAP